MAGVTLSVVSKVYPGGVRAVDKADLDIPDGGFVVMVGPSGCGKSTVLRMIAGLETVTEGEVRIAGERVNDKEPGQRDIAMVFQNYALYPHMSVYDNMAYGLRNQRMPRAEIDRRIRAVAATLELSDYLARKPRQLSGGQRQRVAMGRALAREPAVFLFDEPLSNLDAKLRTQLRAELKGLHRRLGATFVYVTHDQVEAMSLADRIVVLNQGRVEQVGPPMELYDRPASLFVAEFLGAPAMNLIALDGPLGEAVGAMAPQSAARVGIRPEAVTPVDADAAAVTGHVVLAEALGAETVLHVAPDDAPDDPAHQIALRQPAHAPAREGMRIGLTFPAAALHWFDAAGRRLG